MIDIKDLRILQRLSTAVDDRPDTTKLEDRKSGWICSSLTYSFFFTLPLSVQSADERDLMNDGGGVEREKGNMKSIQPSKETKKKTMLNFFLDE